MSITTYDFFKKLCALAWVDSIILYGSRARNDNALRSDIDLAINCPHASDSYWLTVLDIIDDADTLLKIDCLRFDALPGQSALKKAIKNEGIALYRKNI